MTKEKKYKIYASGALFLAALIWGNAFVAQSVGMEYIGPYTFQSLRWFMGALVLFPAVLTMHVKKKPYRDKKKLVTGGVLTGAVLCAASCFQQVGIQYTTVGKAGFITAMYIVLVPVFGIFIGKTIKKKIWLCVALAVAGLYFMSIQGRTGLSLGDALMLFAALFFALQIMLLDYYVSKVDAIRLAFLEFLVTGLLSAPLMVIIEHPSFADISAGIIPLLYTGILSSGVAYTLQIIGQKYADAATASILMSLESVFSLLGGIVILSQIPSPRELVGCALVFAAVILVQI